jgi:purine-binding chemotaxis protein CheW
VTASFESSGAAPAPVAGRPLDAGRHVVFRVEGGHYALPLAAVREVVVTPEQFTRVPRTPSAVTGVINLRGRVVTVVDLRPVLGMGEANSPSPKLLLLDRGRRDLALGVSEVLGIEQLDGVMGGEPEGTGLVRGVASLGSAEVRVLDVERLDARVAGLFGGR